MKLFISLFALICLLAFAGIASYANATPDALAADQAVFRTKTALQAVSSGTPVGPKGNNGVGNGVDPQPPGNPPINDGSGTTPGNPGNKGGKPNP